MIDLHCHILPAIDDGPPDIGTSSKMLEMAAGDGITHLVATPHFYCDGTISEEDINEKLILLTEEAKLRGTGIKLFSGADIRLNYGLIRAIGSSSIPTINGSRYFLLELPEPIPPNTDNFLFMAGMKGLVPVITHPERSYSLLSSPDKVDSLRSAGALFQLTAMSITGDLGAAIQEFSYLLLRRGMVEFIASDAHNTDSRPPLLSKAFRRISGLFGSKTASRIFMENPSAVLENRQIL
ncbi:MAG: CpsB/CapC family capsule biosynthesis tyrosine phosphatase [Nitrospirota bacterium]